MTKLSTDTTANLRSDDTTTAISTLNYTPVEDPYAGLNRAQRRKAMAVEWRALKKQIKRRGR